MNSPHANVPFDELVSAALFGLTLAAGTYRPDHPDRAQFNIYATVVIRSQLATVVYQWRRRDFAREFPVMPIDDEGMVLHDPVDTREPQPGAKIETNEAAKNTVSELRRKLCPVWFDRLWRHDAEGHTNMTIGEDEGVSDAAVLFTVVRAQKRARKVLAGELGRVPVG
jgi:hypothetical protein